jgi:hypothetical protein
LTEGGNALSCGPAAGPRIAYLILAHDSPAQLARLVRVLSDGDSAFYIHIDRKAERARFVDALWETDLVHVLEPAESLNIRWGGFRMVEATLRLVRRAFATAPEHSRFCLLSGTHFPIKPLDEVHRRLVEPIELMRVDHRLTRSDRTKFGRRVQRFYMMDCGLPSSLIGSGFFARRVPDDLPIFQGSQWWALTRPCMAYVLEYVRRHPRFVRFFRHTQVPDEMFFHSIVMDSPFRDRVSHNYVRNGPAGMPPEPRDHGITFLDWPTSESAHPKLLALDDIPALMSSRCVFARKFDEQVSNDLIDLLCRLYFPHVLAGR